MIKRCCLAMFGVIVMLNSACGEIPYVNVTVTVVDEDGSPINDARVQGFFPYGTAHDLRPAPISYTNSSGEVVLREKAVSTITVAAQKDGYYESRKDAPRHYRNIGGEGRNEFFDVFVNVTLREIRNPVPMVARNIKLRMPLIDEFIPFDLFENDWAGPFGSGNEGHFGIRVSGTIEDENYDYRIEMNFPNPHDGIVKVVPAVGGSIFVWPHEAPVTGYGRHVELQQTRPDSVAFENRDPEVVNGHLEHLWIIRFNTEVDEDENVINASYAKIRGRLLLHGVRAAPESPGLSLINGLLYVNPTVNEKSMEFDTNRNLSEERVSPSGWIHP